MYGEQINTFYMYHPHQTYQQSVGSSMSSGSSSRSNYEIGLLHRKAKYSLCKFDKLALHRKAEYSICKFDKLATIPRLKNLAVNREDKNDVNSFPAISLIKLFTK